MQSEAHREKRIKKNERSPEKCGTNTCTQSTGEKERKKEKKSIFE